MDFIVENSLAGKRDVPIETYKILQEENRMLKEEIKRLSNMKGTKSKKESVFLIEMAGLNSYMTEASIIIAQKKGQEVKIIRELNI